MLVSRLVLALPAFALALAASAPAQCSGGSGTLTVTPDGPVAAGDTISVNACGPTGAIALLAASETAGSTTFPGMGPFPSVTLCLDQPLVLLPLGFTGAGGCAGFDFAVPAGAPLPGNVSLTLQAVFIDFSFTPPMNFSLSVETSNTDSLSL
ncbi:MAG TPA: hypothetical protein VKF62_11290 [Planctomycetota bacterium]|nr:hypothetical protein [Planctomycetota bacterium]